MTEILYTDFEFRNYDRPIDRAWEYHWTNHTTLTFTFVDWLKETHNLELEWLGNDVVKLTGSEKDLTWFLMRWS